MALQLTEGKTTFKFISQWFGLKSSSINKSRKSREKYLQKLKSAGAPYTYIDEKYIDDRSMYYTPYIVQ